MLCLINLNEDAIWEENGKVILFNNEQEINEYIPKVMERYQIQQKQNNGNQTFIMQGLKPGAPRFGGCEWVEGLYQGFETINYSEMTP